MPNSLLAIKDEKKINLSCENVCDHNFKSALIKLVRVQIETEEFINEKKK